MSTSYSVFTKEDEERREKVMSKALKGIDMENETYDSLRTKCRDLLKRSYDKSNPNAIDDYIRSMEILLAMNVKVDQAIDQEIAEQRANGSWPGDQLRESAS
jgi:hypothetical protein